MELKAWIPYVQKIFYQSKKSIHVISILTTILIVGLKIYLAKEYYESLKDLPNILPLFLLATVVVIEKDFEYINNNFQNYVITKKRPGFTVRHKESDVIRSTVFSVVIMVNILYATSFLLDLFGFETSLHIIWLNVYSFYGFMHNMVLITYLKTVKGG